MISIGFCFSFCIKRRRLKRLKNKGEEDSGVDNYKSEHGGGPAPFGTFGRNGSSKKEILGSISLGGSLGRPTLDRGNGRASFEKDARGKHGSDVTILGTTASSTADDNSNQQVRKKVEEDFTVTPFSVGAGRRPGGRLGLIFDGANKSEAWDYDKVVVMVDGAEQAGAGDEVSDTKTKGQLAGTIEVGARDGAERLMSSESGKDIEIEVEGGGREIPSSVAALGVSGFHDGIADKRKSKRATVVIDPATLKKTLLLEDGGLLPYNQEKEYHRPDAKLGLGSSPGIDGYFYHQQQQQLMMQYAYIHQQQFVALGKSKNVGDDRQGSNSPASISVSGSPSLHQQVPIIDPSASPALSSASPSLSMVNSIGLLPPGPNFPATPISPIDSTLILPYPVFEVYPTTTSLVGTHEGADYGYGYAGSESTLSSSTSLPPMLSSPTSSVSPSSTQSASNLYPQAEISPSSPISVHRKSLPHLPPLKTLKLNSGFPPILKHGSTTNINSNSANGSIGSRITTLPGLIGTLPTLEDLSPVQGPLSSWEPVGPQALYSSPSSSSVSRSRSGVFMKSGAALGGSDDTIVDTKREKGSVAEIETGGVGGRLAKKARKRLSSFTMVFGKRQSHVFSVDVGERDVVMSGNSVGNGNSEHRDVDDMGTDGAEVVVIEDEVTVVSDVSDDGVEGDNMGKADVNRDEDILPSQQALASELPTACFLEIPDDGASACLPEPGDPTLRPRISDQSISTLSPTTSVQNVVSGITITAGLADELSHVASMNGTGYSQETHDSKQPVLTDSIANEIHG
jgi:hypothetical protein